MSHQDPHELSLHDVHESVDTTQKKRGWRRWLSFIGPAYLVSVGYMDPGNWATDIAGGSKFGYTLIWVLLASNIMAMILQSLSARLGIVTGRDLAQANREAFPSGINFILWIFAEIAIAATDLAEVLGMAIGLQLLFGLPLIVGVSITVFDTFLLMYLQKMGIRKLEAFIILMIAIIGFSFCINLFLASPAIRDILSGFIPSFPEASELYANQGIGGALPSETALYLAIGMIGATVMPHNLYLHSSLIQTRKINRTEKGIFNAIRWSIIDSVVALNVAFLINAAILILAATVFFKTGRTEVGSIHEAHQLLSPVLGNKFASILFAVALIASGQSSTITGTLSGQIVMEGYLRLRINPVLRRLITRLIAIVPAIIFILLSGEEQIDKLLILSQVILSIQLAFAIIPLIHFVSNKKKMGVFTIGRILQLVCWIMAVLLVGLNFKMVTDILLPTWVEISSAWKCSILIFGSAFVLILLYVTFFPLIKTNRIETNIELHTGEISQVKLEVKQPNILAVALDFSKNDQKLLSTAVNQQGKDLLIILIHVVESPSTLLHENHSDDYETQRDRERLAIYVKQLEDMGYRTKGVLGYRHRAKEISRIIHEEQAELLIIGAHGHKGIKDFIFGSTIDKVRHLVKIPVLIVGTA